jgi:Flp pilus assembly protein TadG
MCTPYLPRSRRQKNGKRVRGSRGTAILELALLSPWIFFLGVGALDWGFFDSALISLQAAARTAAIYTSASSSTAADAAGACTLVLAELRKLPNIGTGVTGCSASPVMVTATQVIGPDGAIASKVAVTYTTIPLIPIPGLLTKQSTVTRIVTMRLRG